LRFLWLGGYFLHQAMAASCKMSDLERYVALKGISVRHVRRLCEARKIPATRKRNRWQIDPAWLHAMVEVRSILGTPRELEFTLAAKGIVDGRDWKGLLEHEPEQFRFLYCNYEPHPKAKEGAAEKPLKVRAQWMRLNGMDVTPESLAIGMGYKNKSSLYRNHSLEEIRDACRAVQDPTAPTERRPAKATPKRSGEAYNLAA
jgi:hypothetical protein